MSENKVDVKVEVNAIKRNSATKPQMPIWRNRKWMFNTLPAFEDLREKTKKWLIEIKKDEEWRI